MKKYAARVTMVLCAVWGLLLISGYIYLWIDFFNNHQTGDYIDGSVSGLLMTGFALTIICILLLLGFKWGLANRSSKKNLPIILSETFAITTTGKASFKKYISDRLSPAFYLFYILLAASPVIYILYSAILHYIHIPNPQLSILSQIKYTFYFGTLSTAGYGLFLYLQYRRNSIFTNRQEYKITEKTIAIGERTIDWSSLKKTSETKRNFLLYTGSYHVLPIDKRLLNREQLSTLTPFIRSLPVFVER